MKHLFLSDIHLFPEPFPHPGRKIFHGFLDGLTRESPGTLWILGDLFDFWFEYRTVIPAGFEKTLFLFRQLTDSGWKLKIIPGNHDFWLGHHFSRITGAEILRDKTVFMAGNWRIMLAHGDGLGSGDTGYRLFLKPVLRSGFSRFLFSLLHPDFGSFIAGIASDTSKKILRKQAGDIPAGLEQWAQDILKGDCNVVLTGHVHLPLEKNYPGGRHISLGCWLKNFSYIYLDEEQTFLRKTCKIPSR